MNLRTPGLMTLSRTAAVLLAGILVMVASCNHTESPEETTRTQQVTPPPVVTPPPNDYSAPQSWLCLPERDDYCNVDLTTTVITADGNMTMEPWAPSTDPQIDCFYVYPEASNDKTPNSDMIPGPGETAMVKAQFARFAEDCRPYAPLYRQLTLTAMRARLWGDESARGNRELAYGDVKAAWNYYLAHDNDGRGFVLIGHSEGASLLTELIRREIDGKPVQARLVSAILTGTSVEVPDGKLVGGTFADIPLCTGMSQIGCIIAYSSFRANVPPPDDALFGQVTEPGMVAACVNPAALGGGSGQLHAYLSSGGFGDDSEAQSPWVSSGKEISTPFVSVPGMLTAQCINDEHGSYLSITVHGNPADPRLDDIVGDMKRGGQVQPSWGLHLIDLHLAMGNLLDIVDAQAKAFVKKTGS